jgi:hypothetical protein
MTGIEMVTNLIRKSVKPETERAAFALGQAFISDRLNYSVQKRLYTMDKKAMTCLLKNLTKRGVWAHDQAAGLMNSGEI